MLSDEKVKLIISQSILAGSLSNAELIDFCQIANKKYRSGAPIINDEEYDFVFISELKKRLPNHPFINKVETEDEGFSDEKIKLPEKMLSTNKAFTWGEIEKWLERISKFSEEINVLISDIQIKGTAKLDGFAGYDDGKKLYTRGDGNKGSDISRVFQRGLGILNDSGRGQGPGEIVVKRSYFENHLSNDFEYPRNFQASLIKEKELDKFAKDAIDAKAAFFVSFKLLPLGMGDVDDCEVHFGDLVIIVE